MFLAHGGVSEIISIGDNMYPYVSLLDPAVPVTWHKKFFAQRMASSQAVRINSKGIRFISSQYSILKIDPGSGWMQTTCISSTQCLCVLKTDPEFHARLFPIYGNTVYSSFGVKPIMEENLHTILFSECIEAKTNRVLSTTSKDISVCDVLGIGGDYLFVPREETLYVLVKPTSVPVLIAISVLTVYMTMVLAHHLESTVNKSNVSNQKSFNNIQILCMVVLILLSLFSNGRVDIWERMITMEDECAMTILVSYLAYHMCRWVPMLIEMVFIITPIRLIMRPLFPRLATIHLWRETSDEHHHMINLIIGILALVSISYYSTMDNPYTVVLAMIMASRLMYKMSMDKVYVDDVVGDSIMVAMLVYTGIIPQLNYDTTVVRLYTFQGQSKP
jgi:uncharacterized protein YhhL (DUF1145 family)